jgi:hypothetical protein
MSATQDRKWVEKHLKIANLMALVNHLIHHHANGDSCACHMQAQAIVDRLDWSRVKGENDYYYQTGPREYRRFMLRRPELDHRKYTQCVLRTRDMDACLLHFAAHRGRLPENMILEALEQRVSKEGAKGFEYFAITPSRRKSALKKTGEALEQVKAFLSAHDTAIAILEVHES